MKRIFWKYLLPGLVFAPFVSIAIPKVIAADSIYLVQGSTYNKYMQQGYAATGKRNYTAAANFFRIALRERPGDTYATAAIKNVEGYIKRDRQGRLTFVSTFGKPGGRTALATRGRCDASPPLTALTSANNPQLTSAEYPSFYFYVPQVPANALEFTLFDNTDKSVYKTTLKPKDKAGVISINLQSAKENLLPLEVNKEYKWRLSLICGEERKSIKGSIQRIALDSNLLQQIQNTKAEERVSLYATSGLWEDTLRNLAQLRMIKNNAQLQKDWEDLLDSVELKEIAKAPLLP
jgi:Domain of Unknown Function (DUF928)